MKAKEATTSTLDPPTNFGIPVCILADIAILNFQIFFHPGWAGIHAFFKLNLTEGKDHCLRNEKCFYPKSLVLLNVCLVMLVILVKHSITANQWPLDISPLESSFEGSAGL